MTFFAIAFEAEDVYRDIIVLLCYTLPLIAVLPVGIAVWVLLYRLCKKRMAWTDRKTLTVVTVCAAFVLANTAVLAYFISFSCGVPLPWVLLQSDSLKEWVSRLPLTK